MCSIILESVSKRFADHIAVDAVSLAIKDGGFTVFVGPSGCGKTTLLRLIAGLEDIDSGRLLVDGVDVAHTAPAARGLAMVFQSYALYPHMTVRANIGFALKLAKVPRAEIERRILATASMLNLEKLLDRRPAELSGGQRQRVAIGRAIIREPKAFLFDEPLSNLDAALRAQMRLEIRRLQQQLGATAIYVTHDQAEAMTMADQIVVFRDGRIEQAGRPLDIYHRPENLFVAGFIGSPRMNILGDTIAAEYGANSIGIRPEHLRIQPGGRWSGTVVSVEHLGSETFAYVALADGVHVCARHLGDLEATPGSPVALEPLAACIHRFDAAGNSLSTN